MRTQQVPLLAAVGQKRDASRRGRWLIMPISAALFLAGCGGGTDHLDPGSGVGGTAGAHGGDGKGDGGTDNRDPGGGGGGGRGGQPTDRNAIIGQICLETHDLVVAVNEGASEEDIHASVIAIRERNLSVPDADAFYDLVWALSDGWEGYVELRHEAELTDGGEGFLVVLDGLRKECNSL